MKRFRSGIPVGLALVALAFGVRSASAGQLNLVPILQISGQHSDNIFFETSSEKVADTSYIVNPGIALDYGSKNFVGSLAYQVGFQRNNTYSERDNTVHRGDASLGFNVTKGFFIDVTDNLIVTNDPLAFDASGDRIQRDSYLYNRIVPALSYNFANHGVQMGLRFDRIDIDYDNLIDSYQNGLGANVSTKLGGRSTLSFDFFDFKRKFQEQDPAVGVINYEGRRFGMKVDRRFSPRLSFSFMGGYEDRKFDLEGPTRDYDSFIFEGLLAGEFPEVFSWTLGASQRLNDLAVEGVYKVDRFTFDMRKSIADRLRIGFGGFFQKSVNDQMSEEARFKGLKVEGQYMVAKFMNLWLGYDYLNRYEGVGLDDFTENRVNFGLSLSYGL